MAFAAELTVPPTPPALLAAMRAELVEQPTYNFTFGFSLRTALRHERPNLHDIKQAFNASLDAILEQKERTDCDRFVTCLELARKHNLLDAVTPEQIGTFLSGLLETRGYISHADHTTTLKSIYSADILLKTAVAIAGNPALLQVYAAQFDRLGTDSRRMVSVRLTTMLEDSYEDIPDESLLKLIAIGGKPRAFDDRIKRWDLGSGLFPKSGTQTHLVNSDVNFLGAIEPFFARVGKAILAPGTLIPDDAYRLRYASGNDIHDVFVGEIVPCAIAHKSCRAAMVAAMGGFKLAAARHMMHQMRGLRKIMEATPDAEVIWRARHHGDLPGYIRPVDEIMYIVPQGSTVPYPDQLGACHRVVVPAPSRNGVVRKSRNPSAAGLAR